MSNLSLQKLVEKFEKAKKEIQDQAKEAFLSASKELFDEYPELKSFGWTQYAPYFNDGNPCVFSVNADYPTINGYDEDRGSFQTDEEGGDYYDERELTEEEEKTIKKARRPVIKLLSALPDEIMQEIFGDDIRVTVTRNLKIVRDKVSHD